MNLPTPSFRDRVDAALANRNQQGFVRDATAAVDAKRRAAWASLPDVERLRSLAASIKDHCLDQLDDYLQEFIQQATANGMQIHLAATQTDVIEIVREIASSRGCKVVSKGKSMASEEVELNRWLEESGLEVVETDLGEFIVQIADDHPSHIVLPIIHKSVPEVAAAMHRRLGGAYTEDEKQLTRAAREHLRPLFRRCDLGITGVNFAVAETGSIVLVTNEGNGRYTSTRPRVHVALMGIEKLVPRLDDLSVFVKLLGRSGTGQPITVYTNVVSGPRRAGDEDGPQEVHVVIMDRGRSRILSSKFREALRCIRCGACLNACPVYRSIGGHAYGSVYPGPIGKVITPLLEGLEKHRDLPEASSLCGACLEACPVKIDIPRLLVDLRVEAHARRVVERRKSLAVKSLLWALRSPRRYRVAQWLLRRGCRLLARRGWVRRGVGPLRAWTAGERDFKAPARESFRDLWRKNV